jgi:cell division protein FtsL
MAKRAVKLRGRSIAALLLAGFVLIATGVITRRSYGMVQQQEIERLKNRLDGLSAERETLESQIRTASSRARLGAIAEQRLKLSVATGSQLVFLPRKSSRDTP